MGLLNIFGSNAVESSISIARARELFDARLRDEESKLCKRCNSQRSAIVAKLNDIRAAFAELKNTKPQEPRAAASTAVKDKFAEKAMAVISEFNAKDFTTLSDIERFVSEIEKRIDEIRISPREALHVRFFFEEGSAKIAGQINALVRTVGALKQAIAPLSQARSAIEGIFKDYTDSKKRIEEAKQKIAGIEKERATAISRKITPKAFDSSGMNRLRGEMKSLESKRDLIWQAVDSYFSGADKVLKKWMHVESERDNTALILRYIESPHRAILDDPKFRIKEILTKALSKSEELQVDQRDALKTEHLLSLLDEIARLRQEDEQLTKQVDYMKQAVKSEEFLESQHKADVQRAQAVEKALVEHMKLEDNLRKDISSFDEDSVKARLRLEGELGRFLGMKLKIYDEVAAVGF